MALHWTKKPLFVVPPRRANDEQGVVASKTEVFPLKNLTREVVEVVWSFMQLEEHAALYMTGDVVMRKWLVDYLRETTWLPQKSISGDEQYDSYISQRYFVSDSRLFTWIGWFQALKSIRLCNIKLNIHWIPGILNNFPTGLESIYLDFYEPHSRFIGDDLLYWHLFSMFPNLRHLALLSNHPNLRSSTRTVLRARLPTNLESFTINSRTDGMSPLANGVFPASLLSLETPFLSATSADILSLPSTLTSLEIFAVAAVDDKFGLSLPQTLIKLRLICDQGWLPSFSTSSCLPLCLQDLSLDNDSFSGHVDLPTRLPPHLRHLRIRRVSITDENLPDFLLRLPASVTDLSMHPSVGLILQIDYSPFLPRTLTSLDMGLFSPMMSPFFGHLPQSLNHLKMKGSDAVSGNFQYFPPSLTSLSMKCSSEHLLSSLPHTVTFLEFEGLRQITNASTLQALPQNLLQLRLPDCAVPSTICAHFPRFLKRLVLCNIELNWEDPVFGTNKKQRFSIKEVKLDVLDHYIQSVVETLPVGLIVTADLSYRGDYVKTSPFLAPHSLFFTGDTTHRFGEDVLKNCFI